MFGEGRAQPLHERPGAHVLLDEAAGEGAVLANGDELFIEALAAQTRRDHALGDFVDACPLRPVRTPCGEIRPAVDAVASDHCRLAAIHRGDSRRDLFCDDRFAQQCELYVQDDTRCAAGDSGGGRCGIPIPLRPKPAP